MGVFLFFGATMAALAGVTLLWRGTVLDRAWVLNPVAFKELGGYGRGISIPFLLLSGALVFAGTGWLRRRFWGWLLAVVIISAQVLGNLLNAGLGHFAQGATGAVIVGALLLYLLLPQFRGTFDKNSASSTD